VIQRTKKRKIAGMKKLFGKHVTLRGQRILLGITGGIAAYKAAELARLLVKAGADVQVVMTPAAHEFIGAMTMQAITGKPVRDQLFDAGHEAAMGHIELARWAQMIVVAPASADFIAKLEQGTADTLLHTLCLASQAPVAIAPAMNEKMWANQATQDNLQTLQQRGVLQFGPAAGEQACGDVGLGRMLEAFELLDNIAAQFGQGRFAGRKVVVTAGPTHEPVDAVRFIGNYSSGKMGYAIVDALLREGAQVTLVSGPVGLQPPVGVETVKVQTAQQMYDAALQAVADADIFIACAAVADYRPAEVAGHKIKKDAGQLNLKLVKNPDILTAVAALADKPFCVGFAAETANLEQYAEDKRQRKNLDMVAANLVGGGKAFAADDNALLVLWENGKQQLLQQPKVALAKQLVTLIADRIDAQTTNESA
jgi:phosphopantothenoylcysteine decarboxylase/phosphopantothenate--cysteine ligase